MYKTHHSRRRCQAWQLVWSGIKRYIHQRVCKLWLLLAMVCRHQKGASKSLVKWQVDPLGFPMLNLTSPIKWPGHFNPVLRLLSTRAPLPCDGNKDQVRLMSASWWFWICPIDSYNVMIFIGFFSEFQIKLIFKKLVISAIPVGPPSGRPHSWAGTTGLKRWQRPGTLDLFFFWRRMIPTPCVCMDGCFFQWRFDDVFPVKKWVWWTKIWLRSAELG